MVAEANALQGQLFLVLQIEEWALRVVAQPNAHHGPPG